MRVSVAQIKAKFTAIAQQADADEGVIISTRGRTAYRLLPIINTPERVPVPDITPRQSFPSPTKTRKGLLQATGASSTLARAVLWLIGARKTSAFSFGSEGTSTPAC